MYLSTFYSSRPTLAESWLKSGLLAWLSGQRRDSNNNTAGQLASHYYVDALAKLQSHTKRTDADIFRNFLSNGLQTNMFLENSAVNCDLQRIRVVRKK